MKCSSMSHHTIAAWLAATVLATLPAASSGRRAQHAWKNVAAEGPSPSPGPEPVSDRPMPVLKPAPEPGPSGFTYFHNGADWGMGTCASRDTQSPINIDTHLDSRPTKLLEYRYDALKGTTITLKARAGTLSVDFPEPVGGLVYEREFWPLKRMDFHVKAEHTLKGERNQMEIQLVHGRDDSHKYVLNVAILVWCEMDPVPPEDGDDPPKFYPPEPAEVDFNDQLQHFVKDEPPSEEGKSVDIEIPNFENDDDGININKWFDNPDVPDSSSFIEYHGSLTSPPCTESATWFIRRKVMHASSGQIGAFARSIFMLTHNKGNNRGVMPYNSRELRVWQFQYNADPKLHPRKELPLGPNPRTDSEFQAMHMAKMSQDKSQQALEYVEDVARRLRIASEKAAVPLTPGPTVLPPPPKYVNVYDEAVKSFRKNVLEMARSTRDFADRSFKDAAQMVHSDAAIEAGLAAQMVAGGQSAAR
eukprot:gnl/TRDRNA2_/TRDRNA2_195656_c0_seq1.p1 gnl/TRDRNA2_/TRDRNA2_195656_c0~~gnl/TRDRNA2_/TRDRNA2_195656_c0_seq1.p1  ORF type:complete len:474 (-),score=78.09 gnl/TRDRNA2_/TRDRNA2_195656_c0_seq1:58-1479(-)